MKYYGPFDKPYGCATWSGIKERLKAFLVIIISLFFYILGSAILMLTGLSENVFFDIFLVVTGASLCIISLSVALLGVVWVYFPQTKPGWRKRLTW